MERPVLEREGRAVPLDERLVATEEAVVRAGSVPCPEEAGDDVDPKRQVPREEVDVGADERDPDEDDRVGDLLRQAEADRAEAGHEDELPLEKVGARVVRLEDLGAQLLHALARTVRALAAIRPEETHAKLGGDDEPSRYFAVRTCTGERDRRSRRDRGGPS